MIPDSCPICHEMTQWKEIINQKIREGMAAAVPSLFIYFDVNKKD